MSLLEPTPQPKQRNFAAIIAAVSAAVLLISIGLCGTHISGVIDAGSPSDRYWAKVGMYLFFSAIGGLLLALIVGIFQSQRHDGY